MVIVDNKDKIGRVVDFFFKEIFLKEVSLGIYTVNEHYNGFKVEFNVF